MIRFSKEEVRWVINKVVTPKVTILELLPINHQKKFLVLLLPEPKYRLDLHNCKN